jgi:hypothetical protein
VLYYEAAGNEDASLCKKYTFSLRKMASFFNYLIKVAVKVEKISHLSIDIINKFLFNTMQIVTTADMHHNAEKCAFATKFRIVLTKRAKF